MKIVIVLKEFIKRQLLYFLFINLITINVLLAQQPFATWTKSVLILNNEVVERKINLPTTMGNFGTTIYKPVSGEFKYFEKNNTEFQFEINGKIYSGLGNWTLINIQKISDSKAGDGASITLLSEDKQIELTLNYLLYPNLPVIRKT